MVAFELYGAFPVKEGMTALAIVEALDVFEYRVGEFNAGSPSLAIEQFDLHARPEGLCDRIVVGVTDGSEGRQQSSTSGSLGEGPGGELLQFNQSLQHRPVEVSVVAPRRLRQESSTRGSCVACC